MWSGVTNYSQWVKSAPNLNAVVNKVLLEYNHVRRVVHGCFHDTLAEVSSYEETRTDDLQNAYSKNLPTPDLDKWYISVSVGSQSFSSIPLRRML